MKITDYMFQRSRYSAFCIRVSVYILQSLEWNTISVSECKTEKPIGGNVYYGSSRHETLIKGS